VSARVDEWDVFLDGPIVLVLGDHIYELDAELAIDIGIRLLAAAADLAGDEEVTP
jgi:hypothetical protein